MNSSLFLGGALLLQTLKAIDNLRLVANRTLKARSALLQLRPQFVRPSSHQTSPGSRQFWHPAGSRKCFCWRAPINQHQNLASPNNGYIVRQYAKTGKIGDVESKMAANHVKPSPIRKWLYFWQFDKAQKKWKKYTWKKSIFN